MKTTIDLPESLALNLKITAARRGKIIKSLALETLRAAMQTASSAQSKNPPPLSRRGLARRATTPAPHFHRVKLPIIQAPPGAPTMELTSQRIHELEMESEMESYAASLRQ